MPGSDKEAALTYAEQLVYAAAFATDRMLTKTYKLNSSKASAWIAVMLLRDDRAALQASIDWDRVDAMFESFKRIEHAR